MQLALTKNNDLIISNLQAEGKPEVTPKVVKMKTTLIDNKSTNL